MMDEEERRQEHIREAIARFEKEKYERACEKAQLKICLPKHLLKMLEKQYRLFLNLRI